MPRPIWTGSVSFGLVNVPVKLFTAVRHKDVRFHQLHATDGSRIQQRRVCVAEDVEVPYDELARGYELSPDRYVVVTPEDLEVLDPEATKRVDVTAFVPLSQIDPLYFDTSYYLVPDESGARAYALLVDSMTEAGQIGVGRVVLRTKEYLCAVRPHGRVLVLSTMNYPDEIADPGELEGLPGADVAPDERELEMAERLIELLSAEFDPGAYHDTYRERLLELIEAKASGEEVVAPPVSEERAPLIDLMAALEASVAQAGDQGRGEPEAKAASS